MPILEALAYAYAAATWGHLWHGKKVTIYSDCKPAMEAMNKRYSPSPALLFVIRLPVFLAHIHNFVFRFVWLSTHHNAIAGALSRRDFLRSHAICDEQDMCRSSWPTRVSALPRAPYEKQS